MRKSSDRWRLALGALCLLVLVVHVPFRARHAWNPDDPWLPLGFFACECLLWTGFASLLVTLVLGRRRSPPAPPAPAGRTVDVFLPTLDEDLALLRRSVRRALALRYPHRTWLLDDGARPEVRAMAEELGCGWLAREDPGAGGKAGNLNAALRATGGELVLVLDADAIAHASLLDRTLGFFDDPRVAFVQTPQVYWNADSLESHYDPARGAWWSAQDVFHADMQRGFARCGAALCVGSAFVFRRSAVEEVGGFTTRFAGEDVQLSLSLHAAGWQSRYLDEVLAWHLAPDGYGQFWRQQTRWARGQIQMFRRLGDLRRLAFGQRLVYLQLMTAHLQGLVRWLIRLVPIAAAFTGLAVHAPGFAADRFAVALNALWLTLCFIAPPLLTQGRMRQVLGRSFGLLRTGPGVIATLSELTGRRFRFLVTPKGGGMVAPALAYVLPWLTVLLGTAGLAAAATRIAPAFAAGSGRAGWLLVSLFCAEFLACGVIALCLIRGRRRAADVTTVLVRRRAAFVPRSGRESGLLVVRLGPGEAYAIGPARLLPAEGTVRLRLGTDLDVPARLEPAPARILPRLGPGEACYRLVLAPAAAADLDRITDALDAVEIPRLFASLRRRSYPLPPGLPERASEGPPLYRLRPAFPPIRF
jgi:cellulose synthase (UDP-forming)